MKARHAAVCARCGKLGKHSEIKDAVGLFLMRIDDIVLCDKCYNALIQADARAWRWFRKYRDELNEGR